MKYYISFITFIIFIFVSLAFSKTMKESDVIYGDDGTTPQLCLLQWDKVDASGIKNTLSNLHVTDVKIKQAKKLAEDYIKKINNEEIKEAYCKLGYIGNDLYFRIKSKKKSQPAYNYDDLLLAERVKPKPENLSSSNTEKIELKTIYALTPRDIPVNLGKFFDIGDGYSININITITGGTLTAAQKKLIEDTVRYVQKEIGEKILQEIKELGKNISSGTGELSELNAVIADKNKKLKAMIDNSAVNTAVKNAVLAKLKTENKGSKLQKDWIVECDVKSAPANLKITEAGIMIYFTGGSDISSYKSIAANVKNIYKIITDIESDEHKLRKEMDKSIDDFVKSSNDIVELVEEIYIANNIEEKSTIKNIIDTASPAETAAQDRFINYLNLKVIGSTAITASGEERRFRYKIFLTNARSKLDEELKKLAASEEKFKPTGINKAAKFRPELQMLKKHCTNVMSVLAENEAYCERVKAALKELNITVSGNTSLEKLKKIRTEIRKREIKENASKGNITLSKAAAEIKTGYATINEICVMLNADTSPR